MNMHFSNRTFNRILLNILSVFVILAMAFPAASVAVALEACNDPLGCVTLGPNDPMHIAYALTLSGEQSSLGIDERNGIEIAVDDSGGAILGHAIQLTGANESCSAEGGTSAGSTLAADPTVVAVIGTSCSPAARAAMPFLSDAGLVMVSPSNTAPDLTELGNPNNYPGYLRVSWNDTIQGWNAAAFARESLGVSVAAILYEGSPYSTQLQQAFADKFIAMGGVITTQVLIGPNQTDMSAELANIAEEAPELLYFPVFMPAGGHIVNQVRMTPGLESAHLLSSDGLWTEEIVDSAGENVEGLMVTNVDLTNNSPAYIEHFLPAYQEKFGTEPISSFHAHAYDAFMMIRAAIESVAEVDPDGSIQIGRQALRDALYGTVNFPGLTGNLTCSATGDCADPHVAVYKYHMGQFPPEYIWPFPQSAWRDEFNGSLAEGWAWINENPDHWNLTEKPGFLRIYAAPDPTGSENLLLRAVAEHDFMIKTRVLFEPDTNFQFAGLVLWQDESNFLQLGRAFCDVEGACVGNGIYFDKVLDGGNVDGNFATSIGNPSDVFLRLERRGDMVRAFYSADNGISWYEIGTHWIPSDFQVNGVGLTSAQDFNTPERDIPADFDFFELSEGSGFLPEGFHDGEQGDVPSWACNAGGWATDPDDRAADVNVEVVVDDQTVATLPAGDFRQDLLDADVCVDGNCSFSTRLWDLISSYEPHNVDAWAQDTTSGEWVLLSNSDKTLTCRSYDVYTFDPATGTTKQITNLPDTHEYNPRWSPDGKKIVHDTWSTDWSSHGVYITDVKTGMSSPLAGAEGGSYPTWSPSARWIAFDRGADNDYSVFVVPPTGGTPRLVVEDAFMASWAPRSNRLAFHRPSDGGIWTTDLDGENQTKVVERGNGPAWSPDGAWIAFEVEGDVWKVRVNNSGNPLGDPIQLTGSPLWEGRPTWSYNSKTIAFHAGMGQDTDIWTIPAAGGTATWLTGAPNFGDYDANYSLKGQSTYISYSSFSPDGQAVRNWVSAFTYGLPDGYWTEGPHSYHFETAGSDNTDELSFNVDPYARLYDGTVLLRPWSVIGRTGETCNYIDTIHPAEQTQFYVGWGMEGSYSDALAYYQNLTAKVAWDGGSPVDLVQHEIFPYTVPLDWMAYVCTYTAGVPAMDLRVNYGDNWVESFYEAGHNVHLTVTESDGVTVKATADVVTEPKDYWDGGTGFQTNDSPWHDAEGNPIDGQPDIRPYDWVFASVDNGVTAQVQIGEIHGVLDVTTDEVQGTVLVPWFSNELNLECWGGSANSKSDSVFPDGADPYSCSWAGEWDIPYTDAVGVGYSGPDGHWVANIFRNPHVHIYPEQDFIDADEWAEGLQVNAWVEGKDECTTQGIPTYPPGNPWTTYASMPFPDACDLVPGDVLYASNGITTVLHTIRNLAITDVNKVENTVTGTADDGELVYAWVHGYGETEEQLLVTEGTWVSHFNGFDLVEGMCGRSEIRDEVGNTTGVDWCIPNPRFSAFPESEHIEGWDWPLGATIHLSIDDPATETNPDFVQDQTVEVTPWDPNAVWVFFNFAEQYDMKVGDKVTLTDDDVTRTHIIQNLAITNADKETNIISGTADAGAEVHVWPHGFNELIPTASQDGFWLADFNTIGIDLTKGMNGRTEIRDEFGNATAVDWYIPNTRFTVWPEQNYLEGYEWPDGALVSITVTGKDACSTEAVSGFPEWDQSNTFFSLNFPEACTIGVGDLITLSYESLSFTHQVQELAIIDVNEDANTVSGTAAFDPEQYMLHTWIHGVDGSYMQLTPEEEIWVAQYGFDLQPGWAGRVEVVDQNSNATAVEWRILNPFIEAAPYSDWIHAREWPIGTEMILEIDDPSDGLGDVDYSATATMEQAPWNPNDPNDILADFRWPDEFAPGPGYVLTMTGNGRTKTLTISDLRMTGFDLETDTVSGKGTPNAQIQVCANIPNRCLTRWVTADPDNNWTAYYGVPGTGNDDLETFNVQPGSNGWAADYEADSDRTWFDWWIPNPRMTVFPEWEWFDGYDWPDGATVNISVANKPECTTSKVSSGYFFNGSFGESCDLAVGDEVTFRDGATTRIHTVQNLTILAVDEAANTVEGTAEPGTPIHVWPHGYNELIPNANDDGYWLADFDDLTIDLVRGMSGRSEVRDQVGNATAVDWYIPNPRIVASITEDWFYVNDFAPNTELGFAVYASKGGTLIWEGSTLPTDGSGYVGVDAEDRWNLEPGNYLVITDGTTQKELVIEGFTFDTFDMSNGHFSGTALEPYGRKVWAGIGWQDGGWSADVFTDTGGNWTADYGNPVPTDYQWVAAQIFDADGDATELRPALILP